MMTYADVKKPSSSDAALPLVDGREAKWYRNGYFLRVSGLIAVIGFLLLAAGQAVWHYAESKKQNEQTVRELVVAVTHRAADIRQWYEASIQTLNTSLLHPAIQEFQSDPDNAIDYFRKLATEVQRFSQLRIILPNGQEAVRVDARGAGIIVMTEDELQDKSGRYYFEEAKNLNPGQVYVSKLDLNIENGEIERPFRPTTRLVAPIANANNAIVGYLVVNLDMATPLATFRTADGTAALTELLNPDGYWLAGEPNDRNWGFMLDPAATVAQSKPDLWRRISAQEDQGGFQFENRLYEVETLSVSRIVERVSEGKVVPAEEKLHLVASAPTYRVWAATGFVEPVLMGFFALLNCGLSAGIGYLLLRRRQAAQLQALLTKDLVVQGRMASLGRIVAGVSHEMRTPIGNALTVSTTMADDLQDLQQGLIKAGDFDEGRMDAINSLIEGNRILQKNITRTKDLLNHFSQTAKDQTVHVHRNFDLRQVIINLVETLRKQFEKTGIELTTVLPPSARVNSYSGAIDQVLLSLIMNARQHAFVGRETGKISIRLSNQDRENYLLEVADNGIGIAPEHHEKIFEPFWSLGGSTAGSGLGLAIISNLVQNTLGGQIIISSIPGSGTVFQIVLPKHGPAYETMQESPFSVQGETNLSSARSAGSV
jgi:signal transduction histidine kinase